ncbi:mechanosensitive ion channel family protein, partial [Gemmatimonadota bacterium]
IRLFQFSLLEIRNWVDADQSTGRILNVPNSRVLRETLANFTKGFQYIWHEIPVLITFESNWKQAEEIMKEIAATQVEQLSTAAAEEVRRAARRYLIHYGKLTPIVYLTVKDSGVLLTMRYIVESRRRRGTEEGIWRAILEEFAKHDDIDFAYPTVRYYDNRIEGKRAGKAQAHAE